MARKTARKTARWCAAAILFCAGAAVSAAVMTAVSADEWRSGCADGGGLWSERVTITVENRGDGPLDVSIPVKIGSGENCLPLVGERVESLRLFGPDAKELLFELLDADGVSLRRGTIPGDATDDKDAATFYLPATLEAHAAGDYTLYYGNDKSFPLPDWLTVRDKPINGDFERADSGTPDGWRFDPQDANHSLARVHDRAYSGAWSVKTTVAEGAEPTWIAARQTGLTVRPGERWRLTGYVRGENIVGFAGWYTHIGTDAVPMMANTLARTAGGTFDWTALTSEFTIPEGANRLDYGTVLRGTGTAWFDAVTLEKLDGGAAPPYTVTVKRPERFPLASIAPDGFDPNAPERFEPEKYGFDPAARFAVLRVINPGAARKTLLRINAEQIFRRFGSDSPSDALTFLTPGGEKLPARRWNDSILLDVELPKEGVVYYLAVESGKNAADSTEAPREVSGQNRTGAGAFPGTREQTVGEENRADGLSSDEIPPFLTDGNLVKNGGFDAGDALPDGWSANTPEGVTIRPIERGGGRAMELTVAPEAASKWSGLRQSIPVVGGRTYLIVYRVENVGASPPFRLNHHQHRADGSLSSGGMGGLGESAAVEGWQCRSGMVRVAPDTEKLTLHLTVNTAGTYRFDDIVAVEVYSGDLVGFCGGATGAFQVPSIEKVFPDMVFSAASESLGADRPAKLVAARGEVEPLQIAFRPESGETVRLTAEGPANENGERLDAPRLAAVGYVPVDYPTNYYHYPDKDSHERKLPLGAPNCDGWSGWWPDPLIPIRPNENAPEFDPAREYANDSARLAAAGADSLLELTAGRTRALWAFFRTTAETAPGLYKGEIRLENIETGSARTIPYTLRVVDATLGKLPASGAIYDLRTFDKFAKTGESTNDVKRRLIEFIAQRRLSPDTLPSQPSFDYDKATGEATCDWTEFDKIAHWYFDELHVRWAYMPNSDFYLFGWGLPPKKVEGEAPYEGEYPYADADHAVLRPEFKRAYQARLRAFWSHLKEKGWSDRFVLYISDEPFYSRPEIIAQMKALCAMIREVDPAIKIYASTWRHVPEWDGAIDVWGIGHYGIVPPEQLEKSRTRGDSFWWTTDGQMCLDTPYCAIERLLPWWCWRWGADAYEFWGATWYTYNPFDFGWHRYIPQTDTPTNKYFVRYPDGDGYIIYPGRLIGLDGEIISSVRAEAARDGQEDALLLALLDRAITDAPENSPNLAEAKALRAEAAALVPIPGPSGRYSTRILPRPETVDALREKIGAALEALR